MKIRSESRFVAQPAEFAWNSNHVRNIFSFSLLTFRASVSVSFLASGVFAAGRTAVTRCVGRLALDALVLPMVCGICVRCAGTQSLFLQSSFLYSCVGFLARSTSLGYRAIFLSFGASNTRGTGGWWSSGVLGNVPTIPLRAPAEKQA